MSAQRLYIIAGISGMIAVGLGAFGAHGLKKILEPGMMEVWEKAVLYQFIHTLAILVLAGRQDLNFRYFSAATYCWIAGIALFSGSLYILSAASVPGSPDMKFLGPVTPFGGIAFILGWICVILGGVKLKRKI